MLIDWFTVGAQALNFIVLVGLLKHFLYQPVLDAIAAREQRIAEQIKDAAAKETRAEAERKMFEDKITAFDRQRADLMSKATADADAEGSRLAEAVKKAALTLADQHRRALASQAEQLQQTIAGRAAKEVFAVARKTLSDLANVDLESCMVEVFTRRLRELPGPDRTQFAAALKPGAEPALVRSYFVLPAEQQAAIEGAVNACFSTTVPLRFETAAGAVCGVELSAGGQKLAWTIGEYLRDLQHEVAGLLLNSDARAVKPTAVPGRPVAPDLPAKPAPYAEVVAP